MWVTGTARPLAPEGRSTVQRRSHDLSEWRLYVERRVHQYARHQRSGGESAHTAQ